MIMDVCEYLFGRIGKLVHSFNKYMGFNALFCKMKVNKNHPQTVKMYLVGFLNIASQFIKNVFELIK